MTILCFSLTCQKSLTTYNGQFLLCPTQRPSYKIEKESMFEITVTKRLEFIITLNNHNFLLIHIPHGGNYPFSSKFSLITLSCEEYSCKESSPQAYKICGFSLSMPSTKRTAFNSYLASGNILIGKIKITTILP